MNKMFNKLEDMLGEYNAGMLIAIMCDLLNEFVKDVEQREMRTIEITLNDYFSAKYDFEKEEIVR